MEKEKRIVLRYADLGKVSAPDISLLPGNLDNISRCGCKAHFPFTVVVDLESGYEMKITLAQRPDDEPLFLICKPIWVKEWENKTDIGFTILYSPDNNRLLSYIDFLAKSLNDQSLEIV